MKPNNVRRKDVKPKHTKRENVSQNNRKKDNVKLESDPLLHTLNLVRKFSSVGMTLIKTEDPVR